jgi:cytochrome P450
MFTHPFLSDRIAAADTTSITVYYMLWELSRRPDVSNKLQAELDGVMPDAHTIPDISILQNLPYLDAFVKEGAWALCFSPHSSIV